jgi:hypothetical protein
MSFIQELAEERDIKISDVDRTFKLKVCAGLINLIGKRVRIKIPKQQLDREILVTGINTVNQSEAIAQILDEHRDIYNIHEETEVILP